MDINNIKLLFIVPAHGALGSGAVDQTADCTSTFLYAHLHRLTVGLTEMAAQKLRSNCQNLAGLIKYESGLCYCIFYFSPQKFSETYF